MFCQSSPGQRDTELCRHRNVLQGRGCSSPAHPQPHRAHSELFTPLPCCHCSLQQHAVPTLIPAPNLHVGCDNSQLAGRSQCLGLPACPAALVVAFSAVSYPKLASPSQLYKTQLQSCQLLHAGPHWKPEVAQHTWKKYGKSSDNPASQRAGCESCCFGNMFRRVQVGRQNMYVCCSGRGK